MLATGKTIAPDYAYLIKFDGDRITHMTKVWNDTVSLQQLSTKLSVHYTFISKIRPQEIQVPLFRAGNIFREVHWGTLALELLILIIGFSVGLQVNEWESQRNDGLLEIEYLERLRVDFSGTEKALQKEIANLSGNIGTISSGAHLLHKDSLTKEDHQKLFDAAGAAALVGGFGVNFGTVEELKDTGNMRLLNSKELRIELANLYQSYQQAIRVSEMRNLLRSQSFPVLARQLKPNEEQGLVWDEEMTERRKREIYIALTVLLQNQKYDLTDTKKLADLVEEINGIIKSELMKK